MQNTRVHTPTINTTRDLLQYKRTNHMLLVFTMQSTRVHTLTITTRELLQYKRTLLTNSHKCVHTDAIC
jgi:hypothetical protein